MPVREKVPGVKGFVRIKRSDGYAYYFRYPGQRNFTPIPGRPGLEEAKRTRNKMLGLEEHERVITSEIKFFDFATEWIATAQTLKPRTRRLYETNLRLHLAQLHRLRLHEIDPDVIKSRVLLPMTRNGLTGSTQRNVLVTLGSVLAAALEDKKILSNPVSSLPKSARPRVKTRRKRMLSPDEAATLIRLGGEYKALWGVLLFAGLRISEAVGLTWKDVDFRTGEIHVWRQLAYRKEDVTIEDLWTSLKGDEEEIKDRDVEMSQVLRALLIAHRGDRIPHPKDLVFTTREANPVMQRNAQARFAVAIKAAGLDDEPKLTLHQLRHNFASALIASGNDVGFVADQLGHKDPNVTLKIYRTEFKAARERGSAAAAIDAVYGAAMAN